MDKMGIRTIYSTITDNRAYPFCHCGIQSAAAALKLKNRKNTARHFSKIDPVLAFCRCGEDDGQLTGNWTWDDQLNYVHKTIIDDGSVLFHPVYSQGTTLIRGSKPLEKNRIHYWEIKIQSSPSGTDMMIGIGTNKTNIDDYLYQFVSALGLDENSWGYSFRGLIQHGKKMKYYGKRFVQGCIVGVYLDLCRGYLEFYLNRRSQSIAYRNIPLDDQTEIYPMVCSTSAKSQIKLINTATFVDCLQFRCMQVVGRYPQLIREVKRMPGLKSICNDLFWFQQHAQQQADNQQNDECIQTNLLLEDEAVIYGSNPQKLLRTTTATITEAAAAAGITTPADTVVTAASPNDSDENIYSNMSDIEHNVQSETESNSSSDDDIMHMLL